MSLLSQTQLMELTGRGRSNVTRALAHLQYQTNDKGTKVYASGVALARIYLADETGEVLNPAHEKAMLDREKRRAVEMANRVKEGELFELEQIQEVWSQVVGRMKSRLLSLPSRVVPELMQATDRVKAEAFLMEQLMEAMAQTAEETDDDE